MNAATHPRRILLLHNILWTPYKVEIFNSFDALCRDRGLEFLVLHVAFQGKGQQALGRADRGKHRYRHRVLFPGNIEDVSRIRFVLKLLKELRRFRPDVLVAPGYGFFALPLIGYARLFGKKVIMAFDSTRADRRRFPAREILKTWLVGLCSAYFCYGTKSRDYLLELGARSERVFSGCQAADNAEIERIHRKTAENREAMKQAFGFRKRNFVFVGRLAPEKNLDTLLRAFADIKTTLPGAKEWGLILVGEGEAGSGLRRLANELDVRDVFFTGGHPWEEIPRFLGLADVFVLPSRSETWGMAVNEAMACGLPVIVSENCGSAWDLVKDGENGFLFDPSKVDDLAAILARFAVGELEVESMGKRSREIIAAYTPPAAAARMMEGIQSLENDRAGR